MRLEWLTGDSAMARGKTAPNLNFDIPPRPKGARIP
jgi:hypothetical protein